jgi:hypothetical protein
VSGASIRPGGRGGMLSDDGRQIQRR